MKTARSLTTVGDELVLDLDKINASYAAFGLQGGTGHTVALEGRIGDSWYALSTPTLNTGSGAHLGPLAYEAIRMRLTAATSGTSTATISARIVGE